MRTLRIAQFVAILFTGLFTGLMLTFLIVIQRTLDTLSATEYAKVMQQLINAADNPPVVPFIVIFGLVSPLVILYQLRRTPAGPVFILTAVAWVIFFVGAFLVTIILNVPINTAITNWNVASPPADWATSRDNWNSLNYIRTPATGLSFILLILAALAPLPQTVFKNNSAAAKVSTLPTA